MLDKNPRPDTGQPASPPVAWKTGTSWGFHDAWSVGIFGRYVLVVWIGNFDNTGNPAFVGVQAAAPLFFRIVDALRNQGLDSGSEPRQAPRRVARVEVCAASGDLPNADCPHTVATWYIPGKSPIRISDLHRRIYIDAAGNRACGPGPGIHEEVYEFWTSDMLRLFREAGMPRRIPPPAAACTEASAGERDAPQIVAPLRGVVYTLRLGNPQPLTLSANVSAQAQMTYWFAGKTYLGRAERGDESRDLLQSLIPIARCFGFISPDALRRSANPCRACGSSSTTKIFSILPTKLSSDLILIVYRFRSLSRRLMMRAG